MTHNPVGFKGTVDQVNWAKLMAAMGPRFMVLDGNAWQPTAVTDGATARTVRVAAGAGYVCGVMDPTDTDEFVQFAANTSGADRYDLLVATCTWTAEGGTVVFEPVAGVAGAGVPTAASVATALSRVPGGVYQGLIGVVCLRADGTFTGAEIVDCRLLGGAAGPFATAVSTYLDLLDLGPGAQVLALDSGRTYRNTGTGWTSDLVIDRLRLTSTSDLSETSTLHALQIGPDGALRVAIDNNELYAFASDGHTPAPLGLTSGATVSSSTITAAGSVINRAYADKLGHLGSTSYASRPSCQLQRVGINVPATNDPDTWTQVGSWASIKSTSAVGVATNGTITLKEDGFVVVNGYAYSDDTVPGRSGVLLNVPDAAFPTEGIYDNRNRGVSTNYSVAGNMRQPFHWGGRVQANDTLIVNLQQDSDDNGTISYNVYLAVEYL